jgi:hypothetical protein
VQSKVEEKPYALTFKFVKSEGRKARGNPDSRSAYFVIPENWTPAWIATLRASWANPRGDGQSSRTVSCRASYYGGRRQRTEPIGWRRVQSKVEGKPRQAKRERKTYALTFKLVKSEGRRPVAIQTVFLLTLSFQKTELPPGLPRRTAPRF